MENVEKRAETDEKAAEGVEMNQLMAKRAYWIDVHTYWYLMCLLELDVEEAEKKIPWNTEILKRVFDSAVSILKEYGHAVCSPHVCTPESGRQYRCTLSECGCESCSRQEEFMERERILSNIEGTVTMNGLKIIGGGKDSVIVREGCTNKDFEIRVSQFAG